MPGWTISPAYNHSPWSVFLQLLRSLMLLLALLHMDDTASIAIRSAHWLVHICRFHKCDSYNRLALHSVLQTLLGVWGFRPSFFLCFLAPPNRPLCTAMGQVCHLFAHATASVSKCCVRPLRGCVAHQHNYLVTDNGHQERNMWVGLVFIVLYCRSYSWVSPLWLNEVFLSLLAWRVVASYPSRHECCLLAECEGLPLTVCFLIPPFHWTVYGR